ncbi:MAG: type II toxin-antitoxin system VapC family toxin [Dethiobacter sp.]|nr:type II toxin-antitoxin system VapC family toxin [Dethiobacter sp.]
MLIDSNIIIYATQPEHDLLRQFIKKHAPAVSVVSYIEVLGYHRLQETERLLLEKFFQVSEVIPLSEPIVKQAVALRQRQRMSLGDSIVAATALAYGRPLATRNVEDFVWIEELTVLDPLLLSE